MTTTSERMRRTAILMSLAVLTACENGSGPTDGGIAEGLPGRWVIDVPSRGLSLDAAMRTEEPLYGSDGAPAPGRRFTGTGAVRLGDKRWDDLRCSVSLHDGVDASGRQTDSRMLYIVCQTPGPNPGALFTAFQANVPRGRPVPASLPGQMYLISDDAANPDTPRFIATARRR